MFKKNQNVYLFIFRYVKYVVDSYVGSSGGLQYIQVEWC